MNNFGFEITDEDVETVLANFGVKLSAARLDEAKDAIDRNEAARAALSTDFATSDDDEGVLQSQTEAAYADIGLQLYQGGFLSLEAIRAAGDPLLEARIAQAR